MSNYTPQPKISIITCFLNVEQYLEEAIVSVLAQHYAHWELLLVDDGSTDGSTRIAKKYSELWPNKIIYLEHANHINKGASASRNVGLLKSQGELIVFLDGDDVFLPTMLQQQLELLQKQQTTMVCEATEYWNDWDGLGTNNVIVPVGTGQNRSYDPPELLFNLYPLGTGAAPCICGILVYRDALLRHGGFEESFKGMYDDQTLLVKLYLHESVYISSAYHNRYRQRAGSLVHASHHNGNYQQERFNFLTWFERYVKNQAIADPKINAALKENFKKLQNEQRQHKKSVALAAIKRILKPYVWWRKTGR